MTNKSTEPLIAVASLQADRPIRSQTEDILGFSSFADALALSLTKMAPEDGLVISVEGEWGSGKTSALELTHRRVVLRELAHETAVEIPELEKQDWASIEVKWNELINSRRTHLIRFNPWHFSGQDNLTRAFFTEVGAIIGHPREGRIAKAVTKILGYLPSAGAVIGGGIGAAAGHGVGAGPGISVGRAVGEGTQKLFKSTDTLESAKLDLGKALRESSKKVIIVIDDLDRLLPSEMRAMFSLAKSLGDLPNVFYVLSFDRDAVTKALQSGQEPVGADFLEKIIQVQLKLPPPWAPEIRRLFADRVNAIVGDVVLQDQSRWQSAFRQAIAPYFKTPRDVVRFSNTLQVIWPNIVGDVDLTDLVVLTTLQHFEPSVYQMVFDNIEKLGGDSVTFEDDKAFAARFVPKNAVDMTASKKALAHLFPRLAKGWNEHVWDGSPHLKKREHRRLCTREYYRNYFLFGRDPDRISRVEIENMLTCQNPSERLQELVASHAVIKSRRGASRVAAILDQILEIVFSKPLLTDAAATAILDNSDDLITKKDIVWELFPIDNFERLDSVLVFGLLPLAMTDRETRLKLISTYPRGLSLCAKVVSTLARRHGLHGEEALLEQYVSRAAVESAERAILKRIQEVARAGHLLYEGDPIFLIWIWKDLGGVDEVRRWVSDELEVDDKVLRLAELLPSVSCQSEGDEQKETLKFKAEAYKEFIDVEQLKSRLNDVVASRKLSDAEKIRNRFFAAEEVGKTSRF
ncbi:MAG TPA: P-loop NTPase fold protein [Xanthobacteraceae bacterium]